MEICQSFSGFYYAFIFPSAVICTVEYWDQAGFCGLLCNDCHSVFVELAANCIYCQITRLCFIATFLQWTSCLSYSVYYQWKSWHIWEIILMLFHINGHHNWMSIWINSNRQIKINQIKMLTSIFVDDKNELSSTSMWIWDNNIS